MPAAAARRCRRRLVALHSRVNLGYRRPRLTDEKPVAQGAGGLPARLSDVSHASGPSTLYSRWLSRAPVPVWRTGLIRPAIAVWLLSDRAGPGWGGGGVRGDPARGLVPACSAAHSSSV